MTGTKPVNPNAWKKQKNSKGKPYASEADYKRGLIMAERGHGGTMCAYRHRYNGAPVRWPKLSTFL